jgi:hypothetical protein
VAECREDVATVSKERVMPLIATAGPGHHHFASDIHG